MGAMKKTTKLQWFFVVFTFMLTILYAMGKKDTINDPSGKTTHRKRGKGLLHKKESVKEFAARTKIKYANCMDPLLEGDRLKDGELSELCSKDTHEVNTNFRDMSSEAIDHHLYELFGCLEGYKSHEYMCKWLGFFSIVHQQAIISKAGRYMKLKKLTIEDWAQSVKLNRQGDILSLFTLCALTSCHAIVHLRNGNLWTTVDTPESYDHDKLLSICDIHLAYTGNGQFIELKHKVEPRINISIMSNTATMSTGSATSSANESDRNTLTTPVSRVIGTIKSDLDTLAILLS